MLFGWGNTPFRFGIAWQWDGVNDWGQALNSPSLNFGTGNFSIATWLLLTTPAPIACDFINKYGSLTGYFIRVEGTNGLQFAIGNGATFRSLSAPASSFVRGVWQHIGVVRNGGTLNNWGLYLNGVNIRSATPGTDPSLNTTGLQNLRMMQGTVGGFYGGRLDETQFYNRALTAAEMRYLYNAGNGNTPHPSMLANLAARWSFDTAAGVLPNPTTPDLSGNGNTLTGQNISVSPLVPH
jgi:hypothetical protein